jgi:peptide chain release factor 1
MYRLFDLERRRLQSNRDEIRHAQGGTGDRSDKVRTYNFPQDRVSDHRIGYTGNGVDRFMEGETLDDLITELVSGDEKSRLETFLRNLVSKTI